MVYSEDGLKMTVLVTLTKILCIVIVQVSQETFDVSEIYTGDGLECHLMVTLGKRLYMISFESSCYRAL